MSHLTSTLPHLHFDTAAYAPERRLDVWREAIDVLFEVQPAEPGASQAPVVLDNWLLGAAVLSVASGPGFSYDRSPRAIARDGRDLFMIQIYEAGRCSIVRGAPAAASEPGDLVVTDQARPMATRETAFRNINLLLPRSSLAPLLRAPDAQGGRVLRRDLPLVALARAHLRELAMQAPQLSQAHAAEVLGVTTHLLAAALNGGTEEATAGGVRIALACQIRRFIEEHLHGHDLSPEALAARFGVSRASLYRMFEGERGIRDYVQRRRRARARLDLMNPAHRRKTVAEIAAEAGYSRAQDFSRAYRRDFGASPGEEREMSRISERSRLARPVPQRPLWSEWVRRIRP
jgi:AraC-like DNA-binding protein